jgi:hypothetical protein
MGGEPTRLCLCRDNLYLATEPERAHDTAARERDHFARLVFQRGIAHRRVRPPPARNARSTRRRR